MEVSIGTVAGPPCSIHGKVQSAKLIAPWEDGGKTLYASKRAVVLYGASILGQHRGVHVHERRNRFCACFDALPLALLDAYTLPVSPDPGL
ncbi:hypothetical protein C8Q74DRAFT_670935 [Fomes fomentarius]|nr:hypothetical protein C8Q74DRAFT_670935 [Fomes fomentarius]